MRDIINGLQESDTWKIQLTMAVNLFSSKNFHEEHVMYTKSDNKEFMTDDNVNDIVEYLFSSRYQDHLKTTMEGIQFIFDSVQLIDWKDHKVNFRCGSSYIDSPDWIKNKKKNNKSKKHRWNMFSIWDNCCIKLWRNWIASRKSFKYEIFYK